MQFCAQDETALHGVVMQKAKDNFADTDDDNASDGYASADEVVCHCSRLSL